MLLVQKTILCVDDDADDRLFLSEAISASNPEVAVVELENGMEALHYLEEVKHKHEAHPALIVLDINMPLLDGKQTLERIKADQLLRSIPVVIFTNSQNPHDKVFFSNFGVDLLTKPDNLSYMHQVVNVLLSYTNGK